MHNKGKCLYSQMPISPLHCLQPHPVGSTARLCMRIQGDNSLRQTPTSMHSGRKKTLLIPKDRVPRKGHLHPNGWIGLTSLSQGIARAKDTGELPAHIEYYQQISEHLDIGYHTLVLIPSNCFPLRINP